MEAVALGATSEIGLPYRELYPDPCRCGHRTCPQSLPFLAWFNNMRLDGGGVVARGRRIRKVEARDEGGAGSRRVASASLRSRTGGDAGRADEAASPALRRSGLATAVRLGRKEPDRTVSKADDGSVGPLGEARGHRTRKQVDCVRAGAMSRQDATDIDGRECLDRWLDDRLEDPTGEVKAPDQARDPLLPGDPLSVAQHVHDARM